MKVVLADRAFYGQTGGLTLTGGEPAMQPEFCLALLRMAKQEGIHTCIETSGCFPPAFLAQIKGLCDLVLLDFKDANGVRLQQNTGQSLDQLLENLYRLDQSGIGYCVRSIILKGINDTPQDVIALKKIKNTLHNCSEWTLFPYHGLGNAKREQLGQQYLAQDYTPNESHLALLQKLLQD